MRIKIFIAGDYHGGYQSNNMLIEAMDSFDHPSDMLGEVSDLISDADYSIVNLEYPITTYSQSIAKYGPAAKSNPRCLEVIMGFNAVTLATNHAADFGDQGIIDTLKYCEKVGLAKVGLGLDPNSAAEPLRIGLKGKKISILNFAETQFNAVSDSNGGANPLDVIDNVKAIHSEKNQSDFVIVLIHGGPDLCPYPSPDLVRKMRFYAEEGASAILLHHSRVISPFEVYKNVPIFYGLGNFIHFTKKPDIKEQIGLTVQLHLDKNKVGFSLFPVKLDMTAGKLCLLSGDEKEEITLELNKLNKILEDPDELKTFWAQHIRDNSELRYLVLISGLPNIVFKAFRKMNALPLLKKILLLRKSRFLPVLNIIRNESHNESIKYLLNETFKKDR